MPSSVITELAAERVYAIGDLHGCPDELSVLLDYLRKEEKLGERDSVVFLGDYVDRGPDSKGVIDLVIKFSEEFKNTRALKGNHEDMMLDFLGYGGRMGQAFLYNGGLETIQSYGISVFAPPEEMIAALPQEHYKFLCELESIIKTPHEIFVHAGLNPLRDLSAQNDGDVFWIRDEFIANVHSFNSLVVFGHTPHKEILVHAPYKLGVDTGLVFGNKLSCVELSAGTALQVQRGAKKVVTSKLPPLGAKKDS